MRIVDQPYLRLISKSAQDSKAIVFIHGGWGQNWGNKSADDLTLTTALKSAGWKNSTYHLWWDSSEDYSSFYKVEQIRDRAKRVGRTYFSNLISSTVLEKEISILAYSFGARVAYYALESWTAQHSLRDVILLGGAIKRDSSKNWAYVASKLNGRLINIYNRDDSALEKFHLYQGGVSPCGRKPIKQEHPKIVNRNATENVGKHHNLGRYLEHLPKFVNWN